MHLLHTRLDHFVSCVRIFCEQASLHASGFRYLGDKLLNCRADDFFPFLGLMIASVRRGFTPTTERRNPLSSLERRD